jgi:hypothetical protein
LTQKSATVSILVAEETVWSEIFEKKNHLPLPEMEQ